MKGTEQIRLILVIIMNVVSSIKSGDKAIPAVIAEVGKIIKIRFKELSAEIKDLSKDEIQGEIQFLIDNGFKASVAKKTLENIVGNKTSTFANLIKTLLKKF